MTDYKKLCAELLSALESWSPGGGGPLESQEAEKEARLIERARAALADEPAAPKPKPTPKEPPASPTKRELFELLLQSGGATQCVSIEWIESFANAVLARFGSQQ